MPPSVKNLLFMPTDEATDGDSEMSEATSKNVLSRNSPTKDSEWDYLKTQLSSGIFLYNKWACVKSTDCRWHSLLSERRFPSVGATAPICAAMSSFSLTCRRRRVLWRILRQPCWRFYDKKTSFWFQFPFSVRSGRTSGKSEFVSTKQSRLSRSQLSAA